MNLNPRRALYILYVAFFLGLILLILLANMFFLSRQTQKDFIKMFWRQNGETAEFIALSATQRIEAKSLSTHKAHEFLKALAQELDQSDLPLGPAAGPRIEAFRVQKDLEAILLYDDKGQLVLQTPEHPAPSPSRSLSLAWPRKKSGEVLVLTLGENKRQELVEQEALQELARDLQDKKIADYVSFVGPNLHILAHTDAKKLGQLEDNEGIESSLKDKTTYYYRKEDQYEAVHPFKLGPDRWGVLVVGLDSGQFDIIYEDILRNTAVFSGWVMLLAFLVAVAVWRFQSGYNHKIEQMQRQLNENAKLVSLGNLAAGVAHEIRNPLNSISITMQRLQLEYCPAEPPEAVKEFTFLTDLMKDEVKRINRIVTDFLGFSKPYAPKLARFSAHRWVQHCYDLFAPTANERGVELQVKLPAQDLEVEGDQEKLTQVMLNLLGNALDASNPGTVLRLESRFAAQHWELKVIDQGSGISKDKLAQIFDIYYTTKPTGTGLGLYICRKIVQAHNGTIDLSPNPDKGMTASLILPKLPELG